MIDSLFKVIAIEVTNKCNLSCPFCFTGRNSDALGGKGDLAFRTFKLVIDQVRHNNIEIRMLGQGEPFLNSNFIKMIKYATKKKLKLVIFTNGTILPRDLLGSFKDSSKVEIIFSVDGATQESYAKARKGGDINQVFDNISWLSKQKKEYNLSNLKIVWQFIMLRTNEHEIKMLPTVAKKLGVDLLRLKTLIIDKNDPDYHLYIPANPKYRRKKCEQGFFYTCRFIDPGIMTITWDGNVRPCCFSYYKDNYMGNMLEDTLINIWYGAKYKEFRNNYFKNRNLICNERCFFAKHKDIIYRSISF